MNKWRLPLPARLAKLLLYDGCCPSCGTNLVAKQKRRENHRKYMSRKRNEERREERVD